MLSPGATLCLACSSSLPPRKVSEQSIYHTPCCDRPICEACLTKNPRLARYNPCLRCLGGVGVVRSHSSPRSPRFPLTPDDVPKNVDGGVHDDDVFAIGDDIEEDDSEDDSESRSVRKLAESSGGPAENDNLNLHPNPPLVDTPSSPNTETQESGSLLEDDTLSTSSGPPKYYIRPGDTLIGISLKFGIDGRVLCRLNNLPPSTLRTTPHLLHTRTYLILPPSTKVSSPTAKDQVVDEQRRVRREREIAEKRFQTLTKEVDTSVAKVYVSLAEHQADGDEQYGIAKEGTLDSKEVKEIKSSNVASGNSLEGRAVDRYLDDDEWEARERNEGRGVSIPRFPLFESAGGSNGESQKASKWTPSSWWTFGK